MIRIICCRCGRLEWIRLLSKLGVMIRCCVAMVRLLYLPPAQVYRKYGVRL